MAIRFTRLSRDAVRALRSCEKIHEHGITAERLKNSDLRWSIGIMVDGQRIHRVVGRESEGVTREQAERLIEKLRTKARDGRLDLPKGRKLHRSFRQAGDEYLTRLEATGGKNLAAKRRHLRQHLAPYFGDTRLDRITEFELRKYRKAKQSEGLKDATINRHLSTLLHLLNRAASKDWGWIKPEDKPSIPRVKEARKPIRILTPEQDQALLRAAMEDQDAYSWLFVLFALHATMRHGEIVRRRYDEIDWENCRLWIDKAKAGERAQPITPTLRDALARQREMESEPNGWIFPARKKTAKLPHRQSMAKQFRRIVERAGLDPKQVTPHILRHTGISRLVMAGTDIPTIQKISGHKTVQMVLHYTHVFGPHVDNAISVLDRPLPDTITPDLHTQAESAEKLQTTPLPNSQANHSLR